MFIAYTSIASAQARRPGANFTRILYLQRSEKNDIHSTLWIFCDLGQFGPFSLRIVGETRARRRGAEEVLAGQDTQPLLSPACGPARNSLYCPSERMKPAPAAMALLGP
jgi:hypothetical protein